MESIPPLHAQPSTPRDPAVRRALILVVATFACFFVAFLVANAIVARRIERIVQRGGLVRSWSDYPGMHAFGLFGHRFHHFYEDQYVIRDQYEVYFGDLDRAYVGCSTGITFTDVSLELIDLHIDSGDDGPRLVRELGHVISASFARTSVTDADLAPLNGLTTIEYLDLSGTQVQGPGLVHLRGMPLWRLSLQSTPLDDAGFAQLPKFVDLHDLSLAKTRLSSGFIEHLHSYPQLETLDLSYVAVTDDMVRQLSELPLETLYLNNTPITAKSLPYLAKMPHVRQVYFCQTKITPEDIRSFPDPIVQDWAKMSENFCLLRDGNF